MISPWRDALAWVSVAGRLAVTSYLLRTPEGWVEGLAGLPVEERGERRWEFAGRDPVELLFRTISPVGITASVTVSRETCDIRLSAPVDEATVSRLIALPPAASVRGSPDGTVIHIVSIKPVIPSP